MNLPLVIGIILVIILLSVVFKVMKGALRIAFSLLGVLFLVLAIIAIIAYMDAKQVNDLMRNGNKTLLYVAGDEALAGVHIKQGSLSVQGKGELPDNILALDAVALSAYNKVVAGEGDPPGKELVIMVHNTTFKNKTSFVLNDLNISKKQFNNIMNSEEPKQLIIEELLAAEELSEASQEEVADLVDENTDMFTDDELKGALFLMAFSQTIEGRTTKFLVKRLQQEDITVAPPFIMLKVIKYIPDRVLEKALEETVIIPQRGE